MVMVMLNDKYVEGLSLEQIATLAQQLPRPLSIVLRDPRLFFQQLNTSSSNPWTASTRLGRDKLLEVASLGLQVS
jgi:hypothetical protein